MADYKDSDIYKQALAGDTNAMCEVASCFAMGSGGFPHDDSQALVWFEKSATQGNANAQFRLGSFYQEGRVVEKNDKKAVELYHQAAEQGHANAQFYLGILCQEGKVVEKNYKKAAKFYQEAADKGHANAQAFLGFLYQQGLGVDIDYKKAVQLYRQAAEQGDVNAQFRLGILYQRGMGVEQSDKKAAELYQEAADKGHAHAQASLGVLYHEGIGVEQSYEKAAEFYQKAADQGHAPAQFYLGFLYEHGRGVEQSYEKAVEFYRQAANQGNDHAQYFLGYLHLHGLGVEKNEEKAAELYRKSAEQGHAASQFFLGHLYQDGVGVDKDFNESFKWYREAYGNGFELAFVRYLVLDSFLKENLPLDDCGKVQSLLNQLNKKVLEILQKRHNVKSILEANGQDVLKVCHYTKYKHLENMLEDKDKDEDKGGDKSLLRMYNVRYCNDPTEGSYFFKQAKDDTALHYFAQERDRIHSSHRPLVSTYILSLCDNDKEDNLNLWNLHGNKGQGVCLTLDIPAEDLGDTKIQQSHAGDELIADLISAEKNKDDDTKMAVYRIVYKDEKDEEEEEKEKYETTVGKLEDELAAIRDFIEKKEAEEKYERYKSVVSQIVLAVLGSLPYLYKDDFYRYDKEYRIIRNFVPGDHRLKADDRHAPPRLYYETNLGLLKKVKSGGKTKSPCTIILGYDMKDKGGTRDYLEHRLREICKDQPLPAITFSRLRY